jgi:hypothetical protein
MLNSSFTVANEVTSQLRIWIFDSDHKSRAWSAAAAARMLILDRPLSVTSVLNRRSADLGANTEILIDGRKRTRNTFVAFVARRSEDGLMRTKLPMMTKPQWMLGQT